MWVGTCDFPQSFQMNAEIVHLLVFIYRSCYGAFSVNKDYIALNDRVIRE
jgi:hypothetical protein